MKARSIVPMLPLTFRVPIVCFLLATAGAAYAGNDTTPPAATTPKLDVTMNVVPLDADIEKTVVQTITLPLQAVPRKDLSRQAPKAPSGASAVAQQPARMTVKAVDVIREPNARQAAEARRQAAEAAAEARKDRNNSSAPGNGPTPP